MVSMTDGQLTLELGNILTAAGSTGTAAVTTNSGKPGAFGIIPKEAVFLLENGPLPQLLD